MLTDVSNIKEKALVLLGVLLVLIPLSPINMPLSTRDSGVFLYTGSRILQGELPYLDVWDHKPPVIFYINALGLFIGGGSRWGVWFVELAALLVAAFLSFNLMKRAFGFLPTIFSMSLWLLSLCFLVTGGNLTTEYTLPLQFACLWLAYNAERSVFFSWRGFLIGALCSVAFFTKQNTIGVGLAIVAYLIVSRIIGRQFTKLWRELSIIFLGGISFLLVVIFYFMNQGILSNFWDCAFIFNFAYSASKFKSHILAIIYGINYLSPTYLAQLAIIGWSAGLTLLSFRKSLNMDLVPLIVIGLIDLPIELILVSISGKSYPHYYISLLPVFSLFTGFIFWLLLKGISQEHQPRNVQVLFTICVLGIIFVFNAPEYYRQVKEYQFNMNTVLIPYIDQNTQKDDTVLVWGAETEIHYYSGRLSPTRFVYQYPLYQEGYTSEKIVGEFLSDIIDNKPSLIIDTQNSRTPFMEFPVNSNEIDAQLEYLKSHYLEKEKYKAWIVYEYVDTPFELGNP